ncbi:MAG: hypothetical protein H6R01_900 [Burkholderiaceae bacterium]|nr:hypothetical protein [Burkholderiaceae bacterium]
MKAKIIASGLFWLAGLCCALPAAAEPVASRKETPVRVVSTLYEDFAWQAVFAIPAPGTTIADQSRAVLEKYFDSDLASLFVQDAQCRNRTNGVCKLDFDPIFASQDPSASDLTLTPSSVSKVAVEFAYSSNREKIRLLYTLKQTAQGWRITDIQYANMGNSSLRKILQSKSH